MLIFELLQPIHPTEIPNYAFRIPNYYNGARKLKYGIFLSTPNKTKQQIKTIVRILNHLLFGILPVLI